MKENWKEKLSAFVVLTETKDSNDDFEPALTQTNIR